MIFSRFLTVSILLLIPAFLKANIWQDQSGSCVAWKTKKTMFLFSSQEPVGYSCKLTARLVKAGDDKLRFEVEVPIKSFDSKEPERDTAVQEILKAEVQPEIFVYTNDWPKDSWANIKENSSNPLNGYLRIGKKDYPIEIPIKMTDGVMTGSLTTKFSHFEIEPPSVAGGLVASVDDYLELHFKIKSSDIENFASLTAASE